MHAIDKHFTYCFTVSKATVQDRCDSSAAFHSACRRQTTPSRVINLSIRALDQRPRGCASTASRSQSARASRGAEFLQQLTVHVAQGSFSLARTCLASFGECDVTRVMVARLRPISQDSSAQRRSAWSLCSIALYATSLFESGHVRSLAPPRRSGFAPGPKCQACASRRPNVERAVICPSGQAADARPPIHASWE